MMLMPAAARLMARYDMLIVDDDMMPIPMTPSIR